MIFVDQDKVTAAIREAVEIELLPRFGRLEAHEIREKGPGDLVTVADEAMERHLRRSLTALLPGSITVGEEEVAADPSILKRLEGEQAVWVLDPVDGTTNFSRGDPRIAVIVALVKEGETLAGWIHDPVRNLTAVAEKGAGASLGGVSVRFPVRAPGSDIRTLSGWLSAGGDDAGRSERVRRIRADFGGRNNVKCIGQVFLQFLQNEHQVGFHYRSKPWDFAAGVLITQEAGGVVRRLDGTPYRPVANAGPVLIAPDAATWDELQALITGQG
jgi:fructose-1,6-bisphosphatase/inositol monophosphatase family enzyme